MFLDNLRIAHKIDLAVAALGLVALALRHRVSSLIRNSGTSETIHSSGGLTRETRLPVVGSLGTTALAGVIATLSAPFGAAVANDVTVNTTVNGNAFGNSVAGDPTTPNGSAFGNSLTIQAPAQVSQAAYGGDSNNGDAGNNTVTVSGGTIGGSVFGGSAGQNATGNSVSVSGGTIGYDVFGGSSTTNGNAAGNTVTVSSGTISWYVMGGSANNGNATNNTITVNGGTIDHGIYGGQASQNATGNTVTINAGTIGVEVAGGVAYQVGDATGNTVTINGGTIGSWLFGGVSTTGNASNNTVTVNGGTIGSVYGGWVHGTGNATGNTVTISGGTISGSLLGGGSDSGSGDTFTGNTLNLKTAGLSVARLSNFQYLNFYLPTSLAAGGTMLTVTGTANLTNGAGAASTVNVGVNGASSPLMAGDTVTLIHAGTLNAAGLNVTADGSGMQGVTLAYKFALAYDATDLTATVLGVAATEGSKALSEGYLAGLSGIDRGGDLVAGAGMANAVAAADAGLSVFTAVSGGSVRSETGSYIDLDQGGLVAGVVRGVDLSAGRLTVGAFGEFGGGSYDTENAVSSGLVRGSGDVHHVGGGLLGHMDFEAFGPGHVYAEAAARIGRAYDSFHSADLVSASGVAAAYDASSAYYGVSAATGCVWTLNEAASLDVYGRYFATRLEGDSVRLSTGETVNFDDADSQRSRLGTRLSSALANGVTPYVGAAWEHEFDGQSRATTNGYSLAVPTLRGDTGIGEIGLTVKPSNALPLQVDVGLQGFVGRNEGIAGNLRTTWTF